MSEPLLRIAFRAAKIVMRLRMRNPVTNLLAELRRPPRALIGQRAWERKAQLLGYVMSDNRAESAAGFAMEPLTSDERTLLLEEHQIIVQVNRACLAAVNDVAPYAVSVCDPYGQFGHVDGLEASRPRESLSSDMLNSIRSAMAATPAIQLFAHFGSDVPEKNGGGGRRLHRATAPEPGCRLGARGSAGALAAANEVRRAGICEAWDRSGCGTRFNSCREPVAISGVYARQVVLVRRIQCFRSSTRRLARSRRWPCRRVLASERAVATVGFRRSGRASRWHRHGQRR